MLEQVNEAEGPAVEPNQSVTAVSLPIRLVVFVLLACGLVATGLLSYQWLFKVPLPGCGPQSACERASASDFALFFRVPVAYFGFAFLCALALGWLEYGRRGLPGPLLWVTRAGAVVSLIFLVLIVEHGDYCPYCLAAHACILAVWLMTETGPRLTRRLRPCFVLGGTFLAVMLGFHVVKMREIDAYHARRDAQTQQIIDEIVQSAASHSWLPAAWLPVAASGGHRLGSDDARIHITVFFDYQCPYCKSLDRAVEQLCKRGEVAVTWRHDPGNTACNCHISHDSHRGACRAARLALAAAQVGGSEGFARLHHWLFEHDGTFSDTDIEQALPELHIGDANVFWACVHSRSTRDALRDDIELAHDLGVQTTPAIFVNGVRLDSWDPSLALFRAVQALRGLPSE